MKKFLCYDTEAAARGEINVDSRGMLKPSGSGLPTGGAPYNQLYIGQDGWAKRATITLPVMFVETGATSSATIRCNFEYEELLWRLKTFNFGIMNGQLYIERTKSLFTMVGCTKKKYLVGVFVRHSDGCW